MIGVIGGLGLGAGIHYYKELAAAHEAEKRPLEIAIVHAQMSRIFELANAKDAAGLAKYLAGVLTQLKGAGIHNTYFSIASSGAPSTSLRAGGSDAQHEGLTKLAKTLCHTDFPHLDCAALHIRAIMQAADAR